MTVNTEDIFNFLKDCSFEELSEDNYNKVTDHIIGDYCMGATKLVLFPKDRNGFHGVNDYVIKIPFSYYYDEIFEQSEPFENANGDEKHCWDYCFTDCLIYNKAKKAKISQIFAKPLYIGSINNYPIYIQQFANSYSDLHANLDDYFNSEEDRDKTRNICKSKGFSIFNIDWLTDVYFYYGENFFKRFMNFIKTEEISDLHNNNIGYRPDGSPVLIDYSGFQN